MVVTLGESDSESESKSGPESYVSFIPSADNLPDSIDYGGGNTLLAEGSYQLPAQNGNGDDEWYFLFARSFLHS